MFCVDAQLDLQVLVDVLVDQRVHRVGRELRHRVAVNVTSTSRLPRTGATSTRPMKSLTSADSSGVSSTRGASFGAGAC